MKKERKDKNFIKKPIYPGGPTALKKFITENLKYPEEAREKKIEGTVSLRYTVDHKGNVIEGHVISGLGHGCDEEALRLVKLLKFEVPKTRGVKVQFHKDMHVYFRLPKQKPAPAPRQTQYVYHTTTVTPQAPPAQTNGYQYTVTFNRPADKQED